MCKCTHNPNKGFFGKPKTKHSFVIFKIKSCGIDYHYDVHYKCQYCGVRSRDYAQPESREILDWLEQEEMVDKLKGTPENDPNDMILHAGPQRSRFAAHGRALDREQTKATNAKIRNRMI